MMARTQVTLDPEAHRRAKLRAAELGISLAEYFRRLTERDLAQPEHVVDVSAVFDIGDSGRSDVARLKDKYVSSAVAAHGAQQRRPRRKTAGR